MGYSWTKRSMLNRDFPDLNVLNLVRLVYPPVLENPLRQNVPPCHFYNVHVVPIRVEFPRDLPFTKLTGSREIRPIYNLIKP